MSSKKCSICVHQRRPEIEAALLAGVSLRKMAESFGGRKDALSRHFRRHMEGRNLATEQAASTRPAIAVDAPPEPEKVAPKIQARGTPAPDQTFESKSPDSVQAADG